ncbi:MAG: hypothetical protein HKN76_15100 [Saprospiraceae bacterium]|nr:hypothetical protein [Saprospiraceae bacterium]
MKNLLVIILAGLCVQVLAQNDIMFEFVTMTPKDGMSDELIDRMKSHNDTYHAENPHGARVYSVNSGMQSGKLIWVMGPTTWTDMDNRPAGDAHDDDWELVQDLIENEVNVEYFRLEPSLSNFSKDFDIKNIWIRFTDLKPWQGYRYRTLMQNLQKVYAEKMPDQQRGIFWNTMGNYKDGRDVMTALYHDGLDWMDEDANLVMKYEEVHGNGSWRNFMSEIEDIVHGSDIMMMSLVPEMGGLSPRIMAAERN